MSQFHLSERQEAILQAIEANGFVTIEALAERFSVSAQTIRRDVIAMDTKGLVQRFHGGAGVRGGAQTLRLGHEHKRSIAAGAKQTIARRAAALVPDGAAIYIDVGTTMEAAARALNDKRCLDVFTNSLLVAMAFNPARHNVHVLAGRLTGQDGSLTGENVVLALRALRLDWALIGCSGIESGGRVMDFDLAKIAVKRVALDVARTSVLLAVSGKFGRSARAEVASLDVFDHVVREDVADVGDVPGANELASSPLNSASQSGTPS
ncbi:MAG: DeoR/GlpR family DNA-binding transcription regulator [Silicimonas sp.]|jgi:DeoR family glycerol-3-phosphate regulon repressor|uniref:DeoR/GlpR family DNA-binding transcription regulator n=1 Tax=Roseitalea porphyridii TaxID=1852022 RepID=UPI0032EBA240